MENTLFYRFETIKIMIKTNSEGARYFFDEYVLFNRSEKTTDNDITVEFYEDENIDKFIDNIPEDAVLVRSVNEDLNGMRTYSSFNRGKSERWNVASGMGAAYINMEKNCIRAIYSDKINREDILPFLLFCNNPLISLIRRFGFPFLHAACLNINGRTCFDYGIKRQRKVYGHIFIDKTRAYRVD